MPLDSLVSGEKRSDHRPGVCLNLFYSPFCDYPAAVRAGFRAKFDYPVRFIEYLDIMIDKQNRISIGNQIVHNAVQACNISRMQSN